MFNILLTMLPLTLLSEAISVRLWLSYLSASWSCLLQNNVLVLVSTYSSAPATDESTSGSHFI